MRRVASLSSASSGALLAVTASLFYGSYGVWSRLLDGSFGIFGQAATRACLVVLFLLPLVLRKRSLWTWHLAANKKWWALSIGSSVVIAPGYFYASNSIGIGLTILLFYGSFLVTAQLFDLFLDKRHYALLDMAVIGLAVLGVGFVGIQGIGTFSLLGCLGAVASGCATGGNILASQRFAYGSLQSTFAAWVGAIIATVPLMLIFREQVPQQPLAWVWLVAFAVCSIGASVCNIAAVKRISNGTASLLGMLEIIFGIFFGALIFHEVVTIYMIIGSVCIFAATALPYVLPPVSGWMRRR